jgi:5-methylcytosine-specific restriction endonuclease McrA
MHSKFFRTARPYILFLHDFKCVLCKIESTSNHVHHIDFDSNNDDFDNFAILCQSCHKLVHVTGIRLNVKFAGAKKDIFLKIPFNIKLKK